jgi:hypothetical protein
VTYALGLALAADGVQVASMSQPSVLDAEVEHHPPLLFCDAATTWAGRDALEQGAGRAQGFVDDIVVGFTVDRLFLTAGRLLTPDQALRELIWGIVCRPARTHQEWAGALTVSCPETWSVDTVARADAIVNALGVPRARVVVGFEAASAAADAFSRLPVHAESATEPAVPALVSSFQPPRPAEPEPLPAPVPHRTDVRSHRVAVVASLGAVAGLVAILAVVLLLNRAPSPTSTPDQLTPRPTAVAPR